MTIKEFDRISLKYGRFVFSSLYEAQDRHYSFVSFDPPEKRINHLDGFTNPELEEFYVSKFLNIPSLSAAYAKIEDSKVSKHIIDLYFFNTGILKENYETEQYELLVFHEIVHQIEKNNLHEILHIQLEEQDELIGKKIEAIAQRINDYGGGFGDPDHNANFGALLNYFFRNFDPDRRSTLLGKAMIKNFLEDYSDEF